MRFVFARSTFDHSIGQICWALVLKTMKLKCSLFGWLAWLSLCNANAQSFSFDAKPLPVPPTIDGTLAEGEWDAAEKISGFLDLAAGSSPAKELTEVWVGTTSEGIFTAFYCHEPDVSKIISRTKQAGVELEGEDIVGLLIDPLNRKSWDGISKFFVNPDGYQSEEIAGGRASKREWRGEWSAKTSRVADGWVCEMFVPWTVLNFPENQTGTVLINFARSQQYKKTTTYWADITLRELAERNGEMRGVTFPPRSKSGSKVELLGYLSPEYDESSSPKTSFRTGLDIRVRPNANTTGVFTLNPDFKNIEGDIAGIEFTRSERRLNDVRPFFTEGAGYFGTNSRFSFGQVFYSNRIDDFDQGVKFFGDLDSNSKIGILASREDGARTDGVFSLTHQIDPRSDVRLYGTVRQGTGLNNVVTGANGNLGRGNFQLGWDFTESRDGRQYGQASAISLSYSAPRVFSIARWQAVQPDYKARLGYIPFVDQRGAYSYSEYNAEFRVGAIQYVHGDLYWEGFDHFDGSNFVKSIEAGLMVRDRHDREYRLRYGTDQFEDEGSHTLSFGTGFNVSNRFKSFEWTYRTGDLDGRNTSFLNLGGTLRVGGIDFGLQHSVFRFDGHTEQTVFSAGYEIDRYRSITARFVRQDGDQNWYLAYRNAGGKGLEWYVIVGDPNARSARDRIALKLVWAK